MVHTVALGKGTLNSRTAGFGLSCRGGDKGRALGRDGRDGLDTVSFAAPTPAVAAVEGGFWFAPDAVSWELGHRR